MNSLIIYIIIHNKTFSKCIYNFSSQIKEETGLKKLSELFFTFAKIGVFTFGGGYAMLPMLQKEVVENKKWATQEELMDYYAIGQCTPGVIAVNTATFIGHKIKGVSGAIWATLGVIFPSVVIIGIIAAFLTAFQDIKVIQWAFGGIRAAVVALIANSVIKLGKKSVVDITTFAIFLIVTLLSFFTDLSPVIFVVSAGICGLVINLFSVKKEEKQK